MASLDPAEGVLRTRTLVSDLSKEWGGGRGGRVDVQCRVDIVLIRWRPCLLSTLPMQPTSSTLDNWVR